jgi:hypothetical protein
MSACSPSRYLHVLASLCFFIIVFASAFPHPLSARDATIFDPLPIAVQAKGAGGVPVGTVVAWPVASQPEDAENWLECNGQSTAGYPELAAVVGANVPNYRGMFLRGYGSQTFAQYNGNNVGYTNTTYTSAALGITQGDAIRSYNSGASGTLWMLEGAELWSEGLDVVETHNVYFPEVGKFSMRPSQKVSITPNLGNYMATDNEIRSVNKAVRYLIRAKP